MNEKTQKKLRETVRESYDTAAADFSRSRKNLVWPQTEKLIESTLSKTQRGNKATSILDLGCGNGRLLDVFKKNNITYTGIEQSATLTGHAREKIKREHIKNAGVVTGDIVEFSSGNSRDTRLRGDDTTWDVILLIAILPHIPSRQLRVKMLRGIRGHLAPNGRLIITCWNLRAHPKHKHTVRKHAILKLFGKNKMEFGDIIFPGFNNKTQRYYHAYTLRGLREELKQAGLTVERLYKDEKNLYALVKK
jgi:2-polyprenyl-3-methyl-5-hydroxy-6-metoxy-1,4-benzoquinol methylase